MALNLGLPTSCFIGLSFLILMLVHSLHIRKLTAALTLTCRFLEGEDGEDTAKISQTDIVEAVDIASAAKVSRRMGKGPVS